MGIFDRFRSTAIADAPLPPNDAPIETVERMRRRAIQRLVGAFLLVGVGVSVFALMFDRQPRPVAVDIPIEIPDKKTAKPLDLPQKSAPAAAAAVVTPPEVPAAVASSPSSAGAKVVAADKSLSADEKLLPSTPSKASVATPVATKSEASNTANAKTDGQNLAKKSAEAAIAKPEAPKPDAAALRVAEAARAKALLEGGSVAAQKPEPAVSPRPAEGVDRYIVQFGAFSETARAQEARRTVEGAGLKTYAQEANTAEGKRIRTRVGPFGTRAEAEAAAVKIKALGLPASVLKL